LGIPQDVLQTNKADIAEKNLQNLLETGLYPLAWADYFSMPYNDLVSDHDMWGMMPILTIKSDGKTVTVADRSSQPLDVSMETLTQARGRVKQDKYRLMTLDAPQPAKLAGAVHKGICQTIKLFTEKPPRGTRDNFGFAAYDKLARMLVNTRNKQSWERYFAPGARMYHALAGSPVQPGMYDWVNIWGSADGAERGLYADFLDEVAIILEKPALKESAGKFRESHALWLKFADALLPDEIPLLGDSRKLIQKKYDLFIKEGDKALPEIKQINARLWELMKESETDFPLSQAEAADFRANLRDILLDISEIEQGAVDQLQNAVL
jgi:hypothetical protein